MRTAFTPCTGIDRIVGGADGVSAFHVNGGASEPYQLSVPGASKTLCLATNQFVEVLSSAAPTQGPSSAATGAIMNRGGAREGSCPSVSLCVLVAGRSIYTSTNLGGLMDHDAALGGG